MATDTNLDVESHVVEEASRKLRDARSRTLNPQEIERIDIVGKHLEQSSSATRAMFERDSEVAITQISRLHYDPDLGMRQELYRQAVKMSWTYVFKDGKQLCQEAFGSDVKTREVEDLWVKIAGKIFYSAGEEGIKMGRREISISEPEFDDFLKKYFSILSKKKGWQDTNEKIDVRIIACKRAITAQREGKDKGYWPVQKVGNKYEFSTNTFNWLIASHFTADFYDGQDNTEVFLADDLVSNAVGANEVIGRLKSSGYFDASKYKANKLILSFIAERFLMDPIQKKEVAGFVQLVAENIGGREGFLVAHGILNDLDSIYSQFEEQEKTLTPARYSLEDEERKYFYPQREVVVEPEIIDQALARAKALNDPREFWEDIFVRTGIDFRMTQKFEKGKYKKDLKDFYDSALAERKQIAVEIIAIADMMGFDPETAKDLAAAAQLYWGEAIIGIDNASDLHKRRKGIDTVVAKEGVGPAIDKSMVALGGILKDVFGQEDGAKLGLELAETLESTFGGNVHLRELGWESGYGEHKRQMGRLIRAFSLFTTYMGEQTGFPEATKYLALAQRLSNTLGQINNAIEDVNPPDEKHERGGDIGQVTIFWKTLNELPEDNVSTEEKAFVRRVIDAESERKISGRSRTVEEEEDFQKVLDTGKRCQSEVAKALEGEASVLYERSVKCIDKAVERLPIFDQRVQKAKDVLLYGVNYQLNKFQSFASGDLGGEPEETPIPIGIAFPADVRIPESV